MVYTYSNTDATIAANAVIPFSDNGITTCSRITHSAGSGSVSLNQSGYYLIIFNGDAAATAAGDITSQLYVSGELYEGAEATGTTTGITDVVNLGFSTLVRVRPNCACNDDNVPVSITVRNTGIEATYANAALVVIKVG